MLQRGYKVIVIINLLVFMTALIGFITPSQKEWYYSMLPYYFVISAFVLIAYAQQDVKKTLIDFSLVFIIALVVELLCIYAGWVSYSSHWSFHILGFPLSIGFYWYALTYSVSILAQKIPASKVLIIGTSTVISLASHILISLPLHKVDLITVLQEDAWMIHIASFFIALLCCSILIVRKPTNNPLALYYIGGLLVFFCGLISFLDK